MIAPIRPEYSHQIPISKIPSRLALAKVFSFFGYKHEVCYLLQCLSHRSRAYNLNEEGLKGFVREFDLRRMMDAALELGSLESIVGH